ncbi:hypothetical protein EDF24_1980 [Curtobacterium sp. PhB130]|nr:hypothetical protein EDF24_1980 [Curtobacterium sp. PhB130]
MRLFMTRDRDGSASRPRFRATLALLASFAVAASGLTLGTIVSEATTTQSASAATAAGFDPGNIISDANFYNGSAMSGSSVQSFLNSAAPSCKQASGGPACLKNFTQNMSAIKAVSGRCAAIAGGSKSAATVIAQVGAACGISQKVLLVLLEKEQGIVTTSKPTSYMYLHATGFACPDTAPCDPAYYGFGQQVYAAALQFKRYQASPTSWAYQAGRNNAILYNPNGKCGTKTVYIKNQATAGLYIYTPYTPNAAALSNLYGTGDSCSAYGNRNFWRMYTDWFGSPTGGSSPIGSVDSATAGYRQITVSGWAADPDTTAPIRVAYYLDGKGKSTDAADNTRSDLASRLGANNTAHGFTTTLTGVSAGKHNLCTFAINTGAGANSLLNCRDVTVPSGTPMGTLDAASVAADTLSFRGWAIDPDTNASISVQIRVDGKAVSTLTANAKRADVGKVKPGYGDNHGYTGTWKGVAGGTHTITAWAKDTSSGVWKQIGSKSVKKPTGYPWLAVDEVASKSPGTLLARGWTIDPDSTGTVRVHFYLDGKALTSIAADGTKANLNASYPGYGDQHAYRLERPGISAGKHTLCIIAINVGAGTSNASICKSFSTPTGSPKVGIDSAASAGLGKIAISGSAVDPDTVSAVAMTYTVDGKTVATGSANTAKASLATTYPGYGANHAFTQTLSGVGPGTHTVCAIGKNTGGGSNTSTCQKVAAATGSPTLLLDEVSSPATGQVKVRGWAIDPDTKDAIRVHVYLNDTAAASIAADQAKASLATTYSAFGSGHAFSTTLTGKASGSTKVCAFAINTGAGANVSVCQTLTVK